MSLAHPPICDFGWKAPDFALPATDEQTYALADVAGPNGTLLMFICNHCPYVTGIVDALVAEASEIAKLGIGVAAICANDARSYPQDSFPNMQKFSKAHAFRFPYLHDES